MYPLRGDGGTGIVKSLKEGKAFFLVQTMVAKAVAERKNTTLEFGVFFIIRIRTSKNSIFIINIYIYIYI